jgi:hypothetical protein
MSRRDYGRLLGAINEGIEDIALPPGSVGETGPRLFVTGIPRSGTTLAYQLLCATGGLGFVSNLVARFYRNPAFGAGVQRLISPLLPRGPTEFRSEYGRTAAWFEPHEFGYYWEQHLPFQESHQPDDQELASVAWTTVDEQIGSLQAVMQGVPLVFKNNILGCVNAALGQRGVLNLPGEKGGGGGPPVMVVDRGPRMEGARGSAACGADRRTDCHHW